MAARNIKVVADVSTESGQVDFAADVVKLKAPNADAIFVYTNEEECARVLREARKQGVKQPLIGETNVISQKVIDWPATRANGVKGHVGLTADAPIRRCWRSRDKFQKRFKYLPDHNGIKGYTAVYAVKYATEKLGKFDRKALAKSLHGMTITPRAGARHPDRDHLGREGRHRPHQLPGRGGRRQAEDRRRRCRSWVNSNVGKQSWPTSCSSRSRASRPAASTRWSRSASCCCGRPRRPSTSRRASSSCCRRSSCWRR
jgi:hypothetical protein